MKKVYEILQEELKKRGDEALVVRLIDKYGKCFLETDTDIRTACGLISGSTLIKNATYIVEKNEDQWSDATSNLTIKLL